MSLKHCHSCGEEMETVGNSCPKCAKPYTDVRSESRNLAFVGTLLLLAAVGLVSFPYLFNNPTTQKPTERVTPVTDTLLLNTKTDKLDTAKLDEKPATENNKIPSNF